MFLPLLIIVFGFLALLSKLGLIAFDWGIFWPVVVILLGLSMLLKRQKKHCWCGICKYEGKHESNQS